MKHKLITLFFALVASAGTLFAQSGKCGDNLTWTLDNGILTISGTGSMKNYSSSSVPWYSYKSSIRSVVINFGVTSIGKSAFFSCSNLTSVTIGNSVTSIGGYAFDACSSLTSVTIPNSVTSIGEWAFDGCGDLKLVTLHSNAIVSKSYSSSSSLEDIFGSQVTEYVIGDGVKSIGGYAFDGCRNLTSINIPSSVTSIGEKAFWGCSKLNAVHISDIAAWCAILFNDYLSNPLSCAHNLYLNGNLVTDLTIPNSVTSISSYAFYDCTGLTFIKIPNSVTSIGEMAFFNCTGLTSITIPNSVTHIGDYAFAACYKLTAPVYNTRIFACLPYSYSGEYTIPDGIETIAGGAFYVCDGLTSIEIPNSVTSIGNGAFNDCDGFTSVTIPNSVTSIGQSAFYSCGGLTSVTIPNSVTSIGQCAFERCGGLTSVTIPNSVTSIDSAAFSGCGRLTSVTIPNSVTSIGSQAFSDCGSLSSVTIPNSVTNIGSYAFHLCESLTSMPILNSVTSIGAGAFHGCTGLTSVTIPNSLTRIEQATFAGCTHMTSLTIPNSVSFIGEGAFSNCIRLYSVTCLATIPPIIEDWTAWYNLDCSEIRLYVPVGSIEAYQADEEWKEFNILPIQSPYISNATIKIIYNDENSVTLEWPEVSGAATYIVEIWRNKKFKKLVCTLIFDDQGQLITLKYAAPSSNGEGRNVPVATHITGGWQYIVTGLEANVEYSYTMTAKDPNESTLFTQTIQFTPSALAGVHNIESISPSSKILRNGQLYILRDGAIYNATGMRVK